MGGWAFYLVFLCGLFGGGIFIWLVQRMKVRQADERARMAGEAERSALCERLAGREQQLIEMKAAVEKTAVQVDQFRGVWQAEAEKRSAAEERNSRIPELEATLRDREERIARIQGENAALKAQLSETETKLEGDRQAAKEKLEILNKAKAELSNAFQALSAQALQSNNQSFL